MGKEPEVKKDGVQVVLIPLKKVRLRRGCSDILETIPIYANEHGEWYVDEADIEKYKKQVEFRSDSFVVILEEEGA